MRFHRGDFDVWAPISMLAIFILLMLSIVFVKIEFSEQNVSGIVYNVKSNTWPAGNTDFSIRASENTYVSEENRSSFCLPAGSEYSGLINKAAEDKDIKLIVKTKRGFWVKAPWTCIDNVTVEEKK